MRPGLWLVAGVVLGRPVPVTDRYPHLCGTTATATITGQPYRYRARDCAACPQRPGGRG
ncbi:hypothetical protein GA0070622_1215 [Micromonospora sediminicola]|uniref:Uncharacterized protein n=1 Tax=Micromonospora sediminicola TaxID=946078 RepID=A0A1A9B425_9ACTN|nr:hypothetical protein [Micromonospora sediminicola]SBT64245.1 hypothetical protein GA0070622_1215 [Micromonospora sediminicola]